MYDSDDVTCYVAVWYAGCGPFDIYSVWTERLDRRRCDSLGVCKRREQITSSPGEFPLKMATARS